MLAEKVKKFISANSLTDPNDSVLVAFSGGADSMCLLHILKSLSYNVSAAHLNHMLRGDEADRDENVARSFCKEYDIPFFSCRVNIAEIAKSSKVSEETAGRNERYKFFSRVASEHNIEKIATAHNKNDNAETILMHLIRGCGTNGLAGIPKSRGNIIRPLLGCCREEIEDYCHEHNLPYITDSSNLKMVYTRNKIRHELIPLLTEYNINILSAFSDLSDLMLKDKKYFEDKIDKIVGKKSAVPISEISSFDDAILYRIIARICSNAGLSAEYKHINMIVDQIKKGSFGKRFDVPMGVVELSGGMLSALEELPEGFCYDITPQSYIELESYIIEASNEKKAEISFYLPRHADIQVRSRRAGDKIKIRGMTKKLSDLFIDKKIPASARDKIPLLTVNGEIIYVFGIEKSDLSTDTAKNDKTFVLNISNKEYTNE
ncbi:MAG: tRNA lysidine(34) synthetase TilS [Monoglobales bacterium]